MNRVHVTRGLVSAGPALPLPVRWPEKWPAGLALCAFSAALYLATNHAVAGRARELPLLALDRRIPFLPWTVWVYVSGVFYIPCVYLANRCVVSLNRHLWSFLAVVVAGCAFFCAWPTSYPRGLYPLPEGTGAATAWLLEAVRSVDRPANCLPSLHVALAVLIALGFTEDRRRDLPWVTAWAAALCASALTTKQHFVVDALAGAGLAGAAFWLFHRALPARLSPRVLDDGPAAPIPATAAERAR